LRQHGVDVIFYLMGGPMLDCVKDCEAQGIRMIDVRHEQAAAMMATGYARLARRPSVCMACSGPGAVNLVTGVANANADAAPVFALAGAAPIGEFGLGGFQETDQVAIFRPITRWAERAYDARRLPDMIRVAFDRAFGSRPGPVYLDLPGDVLYQDVPEDAVRWIEARHPTRPPGDAASIDEAIDLIANAERPVVMTGSGIGWSDADQELRAFVEAAGIPFYTTPQGRGVIPEDHELCFLGARSTAFTNADLIILAATRQNYVSDFTPPSRWNAEAKLIQINIDPEEIGVNRHADVGIVGDAKAVFEQLLEAGEGRLRPERYSEWVSWLGKLNTEKLAAQEERMSTDARPIHPLRLCKEVRDFLPRDGILSVDGHEILTFARQSIPFYEPHSINSGPYGCMGVGLPLGIGAKVAKPDKTVLVLHGDGSFGLNGMEMDTALRHDIPIVCVIGNNGGWASDRGELGRNLGYTRYDLMFGAIGCHAEYVEEAAEIRPAIERAFESGRPAVVNVVTDSAAHGTAAKFTEYET
jgi:acetolactate synthase-1/2/3 large subunit